MFRIHNRFLFFPLLILLPVMLLTVNCGKGKQIEERGVNMDRSNASEAIRLPAVAGQFYTSNPSELRREVSGYIDGAQYFSEYHPIALVSPHAGYVFSGWIAGYSYRQIKGEKYDAVVVISPCHVDYFDYSAVLTQGSYRTPLGDIPIDTALAKAICSIGPLVKDSQRGHFSNRGGRGEHSLEVQLPFLQVALGDFKLVPIVMGEQSWDECQALGEALGKTLKGKNALIVASTDLSHFHSYNEANRLDEALIKLLETYNPRELCSQFNSRKVEACGGGPVVSAMIAGKMLGAEGIKVLKHANSGDVPVGMKDSVVGYLSAIVYGKKAVKANQNTLSEGEGELTLEEKRQLMEIAKTTVDCAVKGKPIPKFAPISATLEEERGAFVTLKIDDRLRGCIGYILPIKPLYLTVQEVAESAALRDPRFSPVSKSELPKLEYEISALSPVRKITDVNEIVVGKHGIIIRRGYNQGLLLPQVATEYGWDREAFLAHTCNKAGLPPDAWEKSGTEISIFSAEVFGEDELK
jgi:AmmeMemoRadiSam system protein B/AmmeMemoRadiSam system protein A